jgi:hypothetical protein
MKTPFILVVALEVVPERVLMRIVGASQHVARWNGIVFYEGGC